MSKIHVLTRLDKELMEIGFEKMPLYNRNQLVVNIGTARGIDYTTLTEQDILDYHKEIKRNVLSQRCEDEILKGFVSSNGHTYRTNRDDQINMIGQKDSIDNLNLTTVAWKTEDQGYIEHTADEWLTQVYSEAYQHKQDQLKIYDEIRTRIMNATTHEEIIPIAWAGEEDTRVR